MSAPNITLHFGPQNRYTLFIPAHAPPTPNASQPKNCADNMQKQFDWATKPAQTSS
jgi:hypothetical protein